MKVSIFSTMVPSEMIKFLKYDHPSLYWVLSQYHFTQRDNDFGLIPKNLVPTSPSPVIIKSAISFPLENIGGCAKR